MNKILFIVKNKNEASSRFRVFTYLPYLKNDFEVATFYSEFNNKKIPKILRSFIKRFRFILLLFRIKNYNTIFMQRPMSSDKSKSTNFEYIMSKINPNIIFDFDDALFIQNKVKIKSLISLSKTVICGNQYLADFSLKYNKNTHIIPTTTDTTKFTPINKISNKTTIGWTGTSGNYENFTTELINALKKVTLAYDDVNILFICDKKPPEHFNFKYEFIKWDSNSEVADLQKIDIGLMPLKDTPWTKGKCGFKLIQYGSIGIASIGSDVGVNSEIILDNISGLLIKNENEWYDKITLLLKNKSLKVSMGAEARKHIENNYSANSNYNRLCTILNK